MKSIVIYFSQAGSTKKIAQAIHAGISKVGVQCDIKPLKEVDPRTLGSYDLIGIGSPILNLKEPPNVGQFIAAMRGVDGKHAFAFSTHGLLPSGYLASVVPALTQRGLTVIGWNDWFGTVVYPATPKPYFTDGHPDAIDLKEAEDFGSQMADRSRRVFQGETELIPAFPRGKDYDEMDFPLPFPVDDVKEIDKFFALTRLRVNTEKCNHPKCNLCVRECPMGAIYMSEAPNAMGRNCIQCFNCALRCPQHAIEYDWAGFQRLHDPLLISWLMKTMDILEARGRLRRLVSDDQIGWETPTWKSKELPGFSS